MKKLLFLFFILFTVGCAQLTLEPVNFAWPIESVLDVDDEGMISDNRYSFSANVTQLFFVEKKDSNAYNKESVRIIRGTKGYYYIIGSGFKNVYVFSADNGALKLHNKIFVSEFGLDLPAFNQRVPYIELLEGEEHLFFLNSDGIKGE